ncbi:MAG: glucose-6-phosphate dehydrogenase, partial [Actinomycetes bacterium]
MNSSDALVLFGATGDLARKKLIPALYRMSARGDLRVPVVGVARSDWGDAEFREHVRQVVEGSIPDAEPVVLDALIENVSLVAGDYVSDDTFSRLATRLAALGSRSATHYLAIPPEMFPTVIEGLGSSGLTSTARIVVEKPFGRDLPSAQRLNALLHQHFDESSIFRIDHYLGKESVEDLLVFRFANSLLEPIWNNHYIASVQVTMSEAFGIEGRGAFYEEVGTIRDVLQNHLLQVITLLAMEPPLSTDADALRDEKVKVLKAMRPLDCTHIVRGQYEGYLDEAGVAPKSDVETYVACHVEIDSWRWAGVPFYVRTGKALINTVLEAVVEFHRPPRMLFANPDTPPPHANLIRFRLGADDGVTISLQAKQPGSGLSTTPVELSVAFAAALGARQEP